MEYKNYDPNWKWPEKPIPIVSVIPMAGIADGKVQVTPAGVSSLDDLVNADTRKAIETMPIDNEISASIVEFSKRQLSALEELSQNIKSSPPPILLPITSSGIKRTTDGKAYRKVLVEAYADGLADFLHLSCNKEVRQFARTKRSDDTREVINPNLCYFEGEIVKDQPYIIVDDVLNSGRSIRDMTRYIELNGGKVVGVIVSNARLLVEKDGTIIPSEDVKKEFSECFPDNAVVDSFLSRALLSIGQLTDSEMRRLIKAYKDSQHIATEDYQAYLDELTHNWQIPSRPDVENTTAINIPTDVELYGQPKEPPNIIR
jgi:hypothetical protein